MTRFFIKPYSFVNYVDKDWLYWKALNMTEARLRLWEKHEDSMPPPTEDQESSYAYAGNQTKIPILWNEDDYKYLSQFPPGLWSQALQWRYNEGLLQASKLRDEAVKSGEVTKENALEAVPNDREELVFTQGKVKYVFNNVYTGFRNLLERLEKPIKYHKEHNPPGVEKDTPGVGDVDPFEQDPTSPKHPSNYKHGLMDYDVTDPLEVSDEYIDAIPDEDVNLPPGQERNATTIAAAKERMKKSRHHTFAGMSVLKPVVVSKLLNTWIKAQGLGLLGDVPAGAKDPHTGEPIQAAKGSPKDVNPLWDSHTGEPDEGGARVPLHVPIVQRKLHYKTVKTTKNGEVTEEHNGPVKMPYMNPGVLLPRIVDLSPEQRQKFAERGGFDVGQSCPGTTGLKWAEVEKACPAALQAGQPDDLYNIVRNFDILSPEQREHMVKNQRQLIHLLAAKFGSLKRKHGEQVDFFSQPGQHYAVGFTPNKAKREILPSDLSKDQLKVALDKYYDKLLWEADKNISYFLKWARGGQKLPYRVLDMMDRVKTDLSQVCAALIGLNLNHPNMGIRDPDVGLVGVDAKADPKELEHARYNYAFNFARDLSQAAFGDVGSRRARQKGVTGGDVQLHATSGDEGGSMLDVLPDKKSLGSASPDFPNPPGAKMGNTGGTGDSPSNWDTRRQQLNPIVDPNEEGAYPIARQIWNVPQVNHKIDKFFQTARNRIAAGVGGNYAQLADKAADKLKVEVTAMQDLIKQALEEIGPNSDHLSDTELANKARALALERLPAKLKELRPDLYGDMDEKGAQDIIGRNRSTEGGSRAELDPERQAAEDEFMDDFFKLIIQGDSEPLPVWSDERNDYVDGPEMSLDDFKDGETPFDAKAVVGFIKQIWTDEGAKKVAVPLLMAIQKKAGKPMDLKQAQQAVMAAGVQPEGMEAETPADKPAQVAAPLPTKMPQPAAAKPAMAATDLTGLLADLPNNPAVYEQLLARKAELAAQKPALLAALTKLREANKAKKVAKQPLPPHAFDAQVALGALLSTLP